MMNKTIFCRLLHLLVFGLLSYLCLWPALPLHAQAIQITDVDLQAYPTITLHVTHPEGLSLEQINALRLVENDREQQVAVLDTTPIEIAVLLDLWQELDKNSHHPFPSVIRETWIYEGLQQLNTAPNRDKWSIAHDRIAVFATAADGESLHVLVPWGFDLQAYQNNVYSYTHDPSAIQLHYNTDAALKQLIYKGTEETPPDVATVMKPVRPFLVFSNGADKADEPTFDELNKQLTEMDQQLYLINFAPPTPGKNLHANTVRLTNIAAIANTSRIDLAAPEQVFPLWNEILHSRTESLLQYTSDAMQPISVTKTIHLYDRDSSAPAASQSYTIPQVPIRITELVTSPTELILVMAIDWPIAYPFPHETDNLRYTRNGETIAALREEWIQDNSLLATFPPVIDPGNYTFTVAAEGQFAEQFTPATRMITVTPPPPDEPELAWWQRVWSIFPTGTPRLPRATVQVMATAGEGILMPLLLLLNFLLAAAALVLFYLLRRNVRLFMEVKPPVSAVGGRSTGTTDTEEWKVTTQPKGELVLIQSEGVMPGIIVLRHRITRFGRGYEGNDVQLNEQHISQRQFLIEDDDGKLIIKNLSTTNPTRLNDSELIPAGVVLVSGDVIQFGSTKYRFVSANRRSPLYAPHAVTASSSQHQQSGLRVNQQTPQTQKAQKSATIHRRTSSNRAPRRSETDDLPVN